MSTFNPFAFRGYKGLPFIPDQVDVSSYDLVRPLTIEQVFKLYWTLETVDVTVSTPGYTPSSGDYFEPSVTNSIDPSERVCTMDTIQNYITNESTTTLNSFDDLKAFYDGDPESASLLGYGFITLDLGAQDYLLEVISDDPNYSADTGVTLTNAIDDLTTFTTRNLTIDDMDFVEIDNVNLHTQTITYSFSYFTPV